MADEMGFVIPFKAAQEFPNLFVKQDNALTAYAADQTDANWDAVVSAFVDNWAAEYELAAVNN